MSINIDPELESKLRARAQAEGITIEVYLERIVESDRQAEDEIEALTLEGLNSGEVIQTTADYWDEKHRRLDERLNDPGRR